MMPPPPMMGGDMGLDSPIVDRGYPEQRLQVQHAAGIYDKPQPIGPDPRQAAMAQMQQARGAMGGMQKPMMGSIGQPPPQGMPPQGLPPGRQAPDMQARLQQLMAARGGGPVY